MRARVFRVVAVLGLYGITVLALAFLHANALALSAALVAVIVVTACVWRRPGDMWFIATGLLFGPVAEAIAISRGAWTYAAPDFFGIPVWLSPAWAAAVLLTKRLAEALRALCGRD